MWFVVIFYIDNLDTKLLFTKRIIDPIKQKDRKFQVLLSYELQFG